MPKIRVRIAVAVDPDTLEWDSCGWGPGRTGRGQPVDTDLMLSAAEMLDPGERQYWVEAEIDVEPNPVIVGLVSQEGGLE